MAAYFYRLHPTWEVRLMIQLTPLHRALDRLVRLGGRLDETKVEPAIRWLLDRGWVFAAQQLAIVMLKKNVSAADGKALLEKAGGRLRGAIG